uniref:Uncharacterized protein n=3 Tax=Photinus pyralis TaxID=7054 RepID=A0A1Y1KFM8_PHOPY
MDAKLTWSVIKFPEEDSVCAVPTTWVQNNKCSWPPYSKPLIRQAIENREAPGEHWSVFRCESFRNNVYESFKEASKKCQVATQKSDLDTKEDPAHYTYSSRKRKIFKKTVSSSSIEEQICSEINDPPQLKKGKGSSRKKSEIHDPPQLKKCQDTSSRARENSPISSCIVQSNYTVIANEMDDESMSNFNDDNNENQDENNINLESVVLQDAERTAPAIRGTQTMRLSHTKIASTNSHSQSDTSSDTILKYLQQIVRKQNILQSMMMDISNQINEKNTQVAAEDIQGVDSLFTNIAHLPVNTMPQLEELENYLSTSEKLDKAAKEISQIGGANLYEFISRSCQKLITNQFCGETFSFLGRRRKQPFRNLKLNELLIKASMKQFKQSTIKEVELNISKWLRRCLERGNKQN